MHLGLLQSLKQLRLSGYLGWPRCDGCGQSGFVEWRLQGPGATEDAGQLSCARAQFAFQIGRARFCRQPSAQIRLQLGRTAKSLRRHCTKAV